MGFSVRSKLKQTPRSVDRGVCLRLGLSQDPVKMSACKVHTSRFRLYD